jgi:hypothetical protein
MVLPDVGVAPGVLVALPTGDPGPVAVVAPSTADRPTAS